MVTPREENKKVRESEIKTKILPHLLKRYQSYYIHQRQCRMANVFWRHYGEKLVASVQVDLR